MASKKKKGRGKAKKAEQKQEAAKQMETLDEQMGRLKIEDDSKDEDALLDEAIKLAAAEKENQVGKIFAKKHSNACYHGYVETKDRFIIQDFSEAYFAGFMSSGTGDLGKSVKAARDATNKQYPEVWRNSSKLKQIVSLFLFNAAQHVLEENIKGAQLFAAVAYFFQEHIASCVDKQKAMIHSSKMVELFHTELHTLVKYLKKNIPCN
eukprot:scaffold14401_cov146-Skeletonema_marinoi.AAC.3